jgi:hypothetical protein
MDETGDPTLDFVLGAGPRAVTPDTPEHVIKEVGKYEVFRPFRDAMRRMKLDQRAKVVRMIKQTCRENRVLEKEFRKGRIQKVFLPNARIPLDLVYELEAENKESWNAEMREDTLKCYPGLRLNLEG